MIGVSFEWLVSTELRTLASFVVCTWALSPVLCCIDTLLLMGTISLHDCSTLRVSCLQLGLAGQNLDYVRPLP